MIKNNNFVTFYLMIFISSLTFVYFGYEDIHFEVLNKNSGLSAEGGWLDITVIHAIATIFPTLAAWYLFKVIIFYVDKKSNAVYYILMLLLYVITLLLSIDLFLSMTRDSSVSWFPFHFIFSLMTKKPLLILLVIFFGGLFFLYLRKIKVDYK